MMILLIMLKFRQWTSNNGSTTLQQMSPNIKVNVLKFRTLVTCLKILRSRKKVQTQIRLTALVTNILFEKRIKKVFKILEQLLHVSTLAVCISFSNY